MAGTGVFVGRARELSRLRAALAGTPRLVLVVGDAGVGKTRLVVEGMQPAVAGGLIAVSGGCLPLAEKLPLLPIMDALGELSRIEDGTVLEEALGKTPLYVRAELARLLPQLEQAEAAADERAEDWRRERQFSALAELLAAVGGRAGIALVIEDVHWADTATLDLLTFLSLAGRGGAVTVVVTCRSDEAPLDPEVAGWLANVRAAVAADEIRLSAMSAQETAEQVAALVGEPPPTELVTGLYARGEGNPFFTEQLIAAALAEQPGQPGPWLERPRGLPARLGELLTARTRRCGEDARAVLAALAVAGRPLTEDLVCAITGLDSEAVRSALHELAAARLLAEAAGDGKHRPRHALLAEAVAAGLLPGEQKVLHQRIAQALQTLADEALVAEVAGHWAAAGLLADELPARVAAATAAEQVFAYAEASAHWQRAITLCRMLGPAVPAGVDVPRMYVRAIDASFSAGNVDSATDLAEEAYRQFGGHPDPAVAAIAHERAASIRQRATVGVGSGGTGTAAGLPLMEKALSLFDQAPPSADQAEAWLDYASFFLFHAEGRVEASTAALTRGLEIAETVGATALIPRALSHLSDNAFLRGQIEEAFALISRGRAVAEVSGNLDGIVVLAVNECDNLLTLARFERAAEVALEGLRIARQAGLAMATGGAWLTANASEALLARGRTAEAAALIDPLTSGPPDRARWVVHEIRAHLDLLRGATEAATARQRQVTVIVGQIASVDFARESARHAAELALWAKQPGSAIDRVRRVLALFTVPDLAIMYGWLLAIGMRACADLAEDARARRDVQIEDSARAAAGELIAWAERMGNAPFIGHPLMAANPAERATWAAERSRLAGASDPLAWAAAAKAWADLGCPHRCAYAQWRHAEAELKAGNPRAAATALRAAAAAADGHAPLLAEIRKLAGRAHIPLASPAPAGAPAQPVAPGRYGLTGRELAVLRLLATGRTNAQIGAELYMSPKTASVHVTAILRKLGVTSRVEAAAVAERAGLLDGHI